MNRYAAFISYSHAADRPLVEAFEQVLQALGKRWWARRAVWVFRDDMHLSATPELWPSIVTGLEMSQAFVLLATPAAAQSVWVQKEVDWWLANRGPTQLYIVVLEGTLAWDEAAGQFSDDSDACPPNLRNAFAHEPKYIDLRPFAGRTRRDLVRDPDFQSRTGDIAAALHGKPKADLMGEELRQQRQLTRIFAALGVLLLGLLGGAGWLSWELNGQKRETEAQRQTAVRAKDQAEANFALARKTLDSVIFEFVQGFESTETVQPSVLRGVIEETRRALDDLAAAAPDDLDVARLKAIALSQFADVVARDDLNEALQLHEESLKIRRQISSKDPENWQFQRDVAAGLALYGNIAQQLGDMQRSQGLYLEGEQLLRRLLVDFPDDKLLLSDLAVVIGGIADFAQRTEKEKALNLYNEKVGILRELLEDDPKNVPLRRSLSVGLQRIADTQVQDNPIRARALYEESLQIARDLASERDTNLMYMQDLATALSRLAFTYESVGPKSALELNKESLSILLDLSEKDPDNWEIRASIANTLVGIGMTTSDLGEKSSSLNEALLILKGLESNGFLAPRDAYLIDMIDAQLN